MHPKNLENGEIGLKFHFKMLEFMYFVDQTFKWGWERRSNMTKRLIP
jgi:hypothetical protein